MRNLAQRAAIIILSGALLSQCVVKKDTTASAATSAALAKKIAQGLAGGGAAAPASVQPGEPSASTTLNCSFTPNSFTCTSDSFDLYELIGSNYAVSGYEKFKNYDITEGSAAYKLNGQLNFAGTIAPVASISGSNYTSTSETTFNGDLVITGADSFSVTYKDYRVKTVSTVNTQTFALSYTYSCAGALTVDGINYTIQADCSIAN